MKYLLLVYIDPVLVAALPDGEYDRLMRGCLQHADELREQRCVLDSRQLQPPSSARTLRIRDGQVAITDGPFAETKELLAGFNLIEADDDAHALRIAHEFPWSRVGSIEVRPLHDMEVERRRVGA